MAVVVDASVALAWCFPDEQSEFADRVLDLLQAEEPVVPQIWISEVVNAILVGERRGRLGPADFIRSSALLGELRPRVVAASIEDMLGPVAEIARSHTLTIYDASYLHVALRVPLATLDVRLRAAAENAGARVLA